MDSQINSADVKISARRLAFLKNSTIFTHTEFPGVMTIAEESTAWPQATRPPYIGGPGFSFKWPEHGLDASTR